jgi:probable F420-dependent oxidoreductase
VKIGVRVPCYRRWSDRAAVRDIAETAEGLGFDSLWVQDHLVAPVGTAEETVALGLDDWMAPRRDPTPTTVTQYYAGDDWWLDPFATWGFLAGVTDRVSLGSDIVVLPYRNPVVQAKLIGTLDVLSGGRMLVGTGSGHVRAESEALGIDFDARGRMHDEYIRAIKTILSADEASFDGEFCRFGRLRTLIRPCQLPHPPFYIGGNGRRSIRRAAELGEGWLPSVSDAEGLRRGIDLLHHECERIGRATPPLVALSLPSAVRFSIAGSRSGKRPTMTPVQAIGLLRRFADIGVDHVSLAFPMPTADIYLEQVTTCGRHVLPAFR